MSERVTVSRALRPGEHGACYVSKARVAATVAHMARLHPRGDSAWWATEHAMAARFDGRREVESFWLTVADAAA